VNAVDPPPREIGEGREVLLRRQPSGLEATHLARRGRATVGRPAVDNPGRRRIIPQALGVVHVLLSCKAAEHRSPEQARQRMAAVLFGSALATALSVSYRKALSVWVVSEKVV